jgi:hypothetical protein
VKALPLFRPTRSGSPGCILLRAQRSGPQSGLVSTTKALNGNDLVDISHHNGISNMSLTENQRINAALTAARTDLTKSRHQREAMAMATQRGELIHKDLVTRQAQYIFITLRQAILNFPVNYARHMVGIADEHQAKAVLTKAAHEFLTELSNFSEKAIDSNWLATIDGDGDSGAQNTGPNRPSSGQEIKAEQEKVARRRKAKTATMRKLRARAKIA